MDIKTIAHLARFRKIVLILFRYGFGDVVRWLDLPGTSFLLKRVPVYQQKDIWERIRLVLEELGPTFIKFGQILSLRPDLIPPPLISELEKLQDQVALVDYPTVERTLEKSLQRSIHEVFSYFEEKPLASASLAQVHRAVLRKESHLVAVKVQRPDIHQIIQKDLSILEFFARRLNRRIEAVQAYDLPGLVREVRRKLPLELDFTREARNMRIFGKNFAESREIHVPRVYQEYTTDQVLTMELLQGTRWKEFTGSPQERVKLARIGLQVSIKQILEDGFFNADPHPGNLLIMEGEMIGSVDWGMVGRLTEETRHRLIDLMIAIFDKDGIALVELLLSFTTAEGALDRLRLEKDILDIIDAYESIPFREFKLSHLILEISGILREHKLRLPMDLAIMIKALITAEGTARIMYPELDVLAEMRPFVQKLTWERLRPTALRRTLRRNMLHYTRLAEELPVHLCGILEKLDEGEINIHFQHENLEQFQDMIEKSSRRMAFGVVIASLVISSTLVLTSNVEPLLLGYPAFAVVGYLIATVLTLWLMFSGCSRRNSR